MATGFTAVQNINECPVCRGVFVDLRALPCDHSLCQDCVDHIKQGIQIKCPVCKTTHNMGKDRREIRLTRFPSALKEKDRIKQNKLTGK